MIQEATSVGGGNTCHLGGRDWGASTWCDVSNVSVESGQERRACLAIYWFWRTKVGWGCGFQYKSKNMVSCCEVWSLHAPCNPAVQSVAGGIESQHSQLDSLSNYVLWEVEILLHSRNALCVNIVVHVCIQSLCLFLQSTCIVSVLQPLINRHS